MGAFDGLIPRGYLRGYGGSTMPSYEYFKDQPGFRFFKGFGLPEFKELVNHADTSGFETVWLPQERPGLGSVGISTWYAKALLDRIERRAK